MNESSTPRMSREEMLDTLKGLVFGTFDRTTVKEREALDMAIETLEQEPCDDAISRQAVDELSKELVHTTRDKADFLCNFWEGLRKLPPVTQKPIECDDAVSRQAVIDLISKFILEIHTEGGRDLNAHTNNVLRQILRNVGSDRVLPSVRPQEPTGHWIKSKDGYMRCDQCGSRGSAIKARYCHHCGAKMVEPQESEDA